MPQQQPYAAADAALPFASAVFLCRCSGPVISELLLPRLRSAGILAAVRTRRRSCPTRARAPRRRRRGVGARARDPTPANQPVIMDQIRGAGG
jgi:hypothetical protein